MQTNQPPPSYGQTVPQGQPMAVAAQPMGMQPVAMQAMPAGQVMAGQVVAGQPQTMIINGQPQQVIVMPAAQMQGMQGVQVAPGMVAGPGGTMTTTVISRQGTDGPVGGTGGTQPGANGTTTVVTQTRPGYTVIDDPTCIYVMAVIGFFIPLVGYIGMCVFGCGTGLPPRQSQAFKALVAATIAGTVLVFIISAAG